MAHELQMLSPAGFQSLAAGLAIAEFGAGVQAMGPGPDGGRDLYFEGPLNWRPADRSSSEDWDGYTVFQVKHKEELSDRGTVNATWLWGEVRNELDKWADPGGKRTRMPDQLVFITNVPMTPVSETGGHDAVRKNIRGYRDKLDDNSRDTTATAIVNRVQRRDRIAKIKTIRFWDGNQLDALLTVHDGVRRRFDAFLTASDVFTFMSELTGNVALNQGETALLDHARTELLSDGLVYFDQAGDRDNRGIPVHDVAIDLPVTFPGGGRRSTVLKHVLARGEHVLARDITAHTGPRHIVLTGQPGNGKTTMSQVIVQAYRSAALKGSQALAANHLATIDGTEKVLKQLGQQLPKNRRWPLRVDLAKYAEERGQKLDETLIRYLAHRISSRSPVGNITPAALNTWMRGWPWLLVLDGLDEVTEPETRRRVIERIVEFVNNADADNCDLLVVLTTRPVGYTENVDPLSFETVALDDLTPAEAVAYGTRAADVRIGDNPDRIEKVVNALTNAANDENLAKLLRTPLQVLILSIIVDGAGTITPDRYSLFWSYYDTVLRRERNKNNVLRNLLTRYEPLIQQLHERAGFVLQERSEAAEHSKATLSDAELRDIAWHVLNDAEYKPNDRHADVLEAIVKAATQRLVLIAPRETGFGFDVRSLQELMAALRISNSPMDTVLSRLRLLAPSPHWRNTWLFVAGKLFSQPQPHDHQALVELVESIDRNVPERLGDPLPIGHHLALDVLDDGMARTWPGWSERLLKHGIHFLDDPAPADLHRSVHILLRYADNGVDQRSSVVEAIRGTVGATADRQTARNAALLIPAIEADVKVHDRTKGLALLIEQLANTAPTTPSEPDWDNFNIEIETSPHAEHAHELVTDAVDAIRSLATGQPLTSDLVQHLREGLDHPGAAAVVNAALTHVLRQDVALLKVLRDQFMADRCRAPVGDRVISEQGAAVGRR